MRGPTEGWCPTLSAEALCELTLFSGEWLCSEIVPLPRNPLSMDGAPSRCSLPTLSADSRKPGFCGFFQPIAVCPGVPIKQCHGPLMMMPHTPQEGMERFITRTVEVSGDYREAS